MTDTPREDASLFPASAGDRLREAREKQKLSIADIAQRTRVPIRHLEAIEQGNYGELPSPTYAIGFSTAYARSVATDEVAIGDLVRTEAGVPRPPPAEHRPPQHPHPPPPPP